jgi:hypothetical protein
MATALNDEILKFNDLTGEIAFALSKCLSFKTTKCVSLPDLDETLKLFVEDADLLESINGVYTDFYLAPDGFWFHSPKKDLTSFTIIQGNKVSLPAYLSLFLAPGIWTLLSAQALVGKEIDAATSKDLEDKKQRAESQNKVVEAFRDLNFEVLKDIPGVPTDAVDDLISMNKTYFETVEKIKPIFDTRFGSFKVTLRDFASRLVNLDYYHRNPQAKFRDIIDEYLPFIDYSGHLKICPTYMSEVDYSQFLISEVNAQYLSLGMFPYELMMEYYRDGINPMLEACYDMLTDRVGDILVRELL